MLSRDVVRCDNYYKAVLRTTEDQHTLVLQSTTYYTVLELQSTTSVLQSTAPRYKVLLRTSTTQHYPVELRTVILAFMFDTIVVTHETSSMVRGATYGMKKLL